MRGKWDRNGVCAKPEVSERAGSDTTYRAEVYAANGGAGWYSGHRIWCRGAILCEELPLLGSTRFPTCDEARCDGWQRVAAELEDFFSSLTDRALLFAAKDLHMKAERRARELAEKQLELFPEIAHVS